MPARKLSDDNNACCFEVELRAPGKRAMGLRMRKHVIFGLVVLALCSNLATAVPDGAAGQPGGAPATSKEADIRRLMELSGSASLGKQVMVQMLSRFRETMPQVPAEFWSGLEKEIRTDDMINLVVPIYARHFSQPDIRELIKFYESPIGRKLVARQPDIVRESMGVGQEWGKQMAGRVIQKLKEKGYMKAT